MPVIHPSPTLLCGPYGTTMLVLSLGFLIGNFLWRATLLPRWNAGVPGAPLLSGALRVLVIAIGVVMALEQLGEEQFRAKEARYRRRSGSLAGRPTTANLQPPNALSRRRWELGIGRWELTRALFDRAMNIRLRVTRKLTLRSSGTC
jgi:hypothetical protein